MPGVIAVIIIIFLTSLFIERHGNAFAYPFCKSGLFARVTVGTNIVTVVVTTVAAAAITVAATTTAPASLGL